jgi:hypothetical protein
MPQAIAGFIIAATGATGAAATAITVASYVAVTAATVYAAQEAAKAAAEDALKALESDMGTQTSMSFRTDYPRRVIYGETRLSGPVAYAGTSSEVNSPDNEFLHLVILLGEGPIQSIDDVYLGDVNLDLVTDGTDGNGNTRYVPHANNKYAGLVRVKKHLGATNQEHDPDLSGEISEITSNHRFRGISYVYVRLKYDQDLLSGIPNITTQVKGRKVYDPRNNTTAWSNNPALCIRDFLLNENGLDADSSEVDDTRISEQANICDQTISLANNQTQKRYTLDGTVSLADSPIETMEQMLATCMGTLPYVQGKHQLQVAYPIPASRNHAVDESFLAGGVSIQTDGGKSKRINSVRGKFMNPDDNYAVVDFTPYTDSTYINDDGQKLWADVSYNLVKSNVTGQRLAKMMVERNRQNLTIKLKCNMKAFGFAVNDTITFTLNPTGTNALFSSKRFRITGWQLNEDGSIDLEGVEEPAGTGGTDNINNTIYDWNSGDSFGIDLAPNTSLPAANFTAPPTSATLTEVADIQDDGSLFTSAEATWTSSAAAFIGEYEIDLQINLSGNWLTTTSQKVGSQITKVTFSGLIVGKAYRAAVRAVSVIGVRSTDSTSTSTTIAGDSTAPAVATPTGTPGHKRVKLSWTNPSDADFAGVEFVRKIATGKPAANTVPTFTVAGIPDRVQDVIDEGLTNGTNYRYWMRTKDYTGNASDWRPNNNTGLVKTPSAEALGSFDNSTSGFVDATGAAAAAPIQEVQINGTTVTPTATGVANVGAITGLTLNGTALTASSGGVSITALTGLSFNGTAVTATTEGGVSVSALTGVTFGNGNTASVSSAGDITLGDMAGIDGITTANASTFLADTIITNDMLAGSITAGKLQATTLSGIFVDAGTLTAGVLQSTDGDFVIDLNNKTITITV